VKVIGSEKLVDFSIRHGNAKDALEAWFVVIKHATWKSTHEIKARYPGADFLSGNRVIFNIKGNHYRLVVKIDYEKQKAIIEWLGTHALYDKLKLQ
jgi:mRNA interferase HigB